MKIGFNPGSIVDASGAPLQGRVLVYVHDSLEKKSIYTMEGSDYVASENPVLLDTTGRIPTTLFFDVGVVDVLVQKYVGEPGHLADESPDEDFEDFDRFEAGFDFDPEQEAARTVETIDDLKDIENPSGVVRVNCYTTPGDTFPRYYLWNPNCSASEDGGCVISDDHDASGKWCYLCEGDSIKSSVYGIKPGTDEANLGAFCGAPLAVSGDYAINYPTSLYFEGGTYSQTTTSIMVSNNRTAVFSCTAKFTQATIYAYDVDVDGVCLNHDYISDFVITQSQYENSATIRSSWCRSLGGFWRSGAKHLILDRSHLSNDVITSKIDISEAIIDGVYFTPTYTFTSGAYLNFDKCHFVGAKWIFREDDYLKFTDCNFTDDLFWGITLSTVDFGTIAGGHHIEVDAWKITDSLDADVWLKWANASGLTSVDLCGRSVTGLLNSNIKEFRNGMFLGGSVATNVNVTFVDIAGNVNVYPMVSGKNLVIIRCDNVGIDGAIAFASITVKDSVVVANNGIDNSDTSYAHDGGEVQATFKCAGWNAASGTHAKGKNVILKNLTASIGNFSWFDNLVMQGCSVDNPIHVIPYESSGSLYLDVMLIGNIFGSNGYVEFMDASVSNADIYGVKSQNITIKDNLFYTSGDGIKMMYFNGAQYYLGSDVVSIYEGNRGSCPLESLASSQLMSTYTEGSGTYKYQQTVRKYWNLSVNSYEQIGDGLKMNEVGGTWTITPIDMFYLHSTEISPNNNQFDVQLAVYATEYASTPNASIRIFDDN